MQTTVEAKSYHCRHILTTGHRCRAKSLRHQDFCFYHTTTRPKPTQPAPENPREATFDLPFPEDRAAIQISIGEVLRRIARNQIDPRRAGLLLYGLQIASLNLPPHARPARSTDEADEEDTVEEVTDHPTLGPIAPIAEYLSESVQLGPFARLVQEVEQEAAHAAELRKCESQSEELALKERAVGASTDSASACAPAAAVLPTVQGVAAPSVRRARSLENRQMPAASGPTGRASVVRHDRDSCRTSPACSAEAPYQACNRVLAKSPAASRPHQPFATQV